MNFEASRIEEAVRRFKKEYFDEEPYGNYIGGVGTTRIYIAEHSKNRYKASLEEVRKQMLREGKDPEGLCIFVGLEKPLPESLAPLPAVYQGFKVYVEVVGKTTLI